MKLKWYGTATILLEQEGTELLFDPFLSRNEKVFQPPIGELSTKGDILITHGHLDHLADVPAILEHGGGKATVYCTKKPCDILTSKGVEVEHLNQISTGDVLRFGPFTVRVLKGKHIAFSIWLLTKKLLNPCNLLYRDKLRYLLTENKVCTEAGETVIFDITASGKRILLLGSLNLDINTDYPTGADLLILPYQGRSDMLKYTMPIIERLKPKRVLLDHFDSTFPPISSPMKTWRFVSHMRKAYPNVAVICPTASDKWITAESLFI